MAFLDFLKTKENRGERVKDRPKHASAEKTEASSTEEKAGFKEKTPVSLRAAAVLIAPHVTEKSTKGSEDGVYTFKVKDDANKPEIKKGVEELYGVHVDAVHIINIPSKRRFSRGRQGSTKGYKKALVVLASGEKIDVA